MEISGIYQIQSKIKPERIYIGSSVDVYSRWGVHLKRLKNKKHQRKLQNHYNKYGKDDLEFFILCCCSELGLDKIEQQYIDTLNPWFNICPVAYSTRGTTQSIESNLKRSLALTGRPQKKRGKLSAELISMRVKARAGYRHSEETKQKMREAALNRTDKQVAWNKGIKTPDDVRDKLRISHLGITQSIETRRKRSLSLKTAHAKRKMLLKEI
ncbi:GIY-YIG nuclease family protein [Sulfuricurvum sp. MLSB]|jgi:group I intron endonuclease|uniref:GIY-YIG nuclease family protein n=1 Tax=Sulfuricurvum sp. MLSB TaxID=1537917 RepID=UPI0025EA1D39|nr:GIY-YIG nuclease family protein [Sulfuricurvum sp. MLSB]